MVSGTLGIDNPRSAAPPSAQIAHSLDDGGVGLFSLFDSRLGGSAPSENDEETSTGKPSTGSRHLQQGKGEKGGLLEVHPQAVPLRF